MFDYTTSTVLLKNVSWSINSDPTGMVNLWIMGQTFPLPLSSPRNGYVIKRTNTKKVLIKTPYNDQGPTTFQEIKDEKRLLSWIQQFSITLVNIMKKRDVENSTYLSLVSGTPLSWVSESLQNKWYIICIDILCTTLFVLFVQTIFVKFRCIYASKDR